MTNSRAFYAVIWTADSKSYTRTFETLAEARNFAFQRFGGDPDTPWSIERRQQVPVAGQPAQFEQPPGKEASRAPRRRARWREAAEQLAWRNRVLEQLNRKRAADEEPLSEPWWEPDGNLR